VNISKIFSFVSLSESTRILSFLGCKNKGGEVLTLVGATDGSVRVEVSPIGTYYFSLGRSDDTGVAGREKSNDLLVS
jgi:hypothetical protein